MCTLSPSEMDVPKKQIQTYRPGTNCDQVVIKSCEMEKNGQRIKL